MITDELLFRFLNQETSKRESLGIQEWLSANPENTKRLDHLREIFELSGQSLNNDAITADWNAIESGFHAPESRRNLQTSLSVRLARIAAVLLLLVGSGLMWFFQSNTHVIRNKDLYAKCVFLPDGTQVDLGPGSKLVYGNEFLDSNRVIRLTGEAYFDVTSDPDHPFIVLAGPARIKVTGTRFVVIAPPRSEEVEVNVKSGIVLFYNSDTMNKNSFRMGLVAGEKGIFSPALNRMDKSRDPSYQSAP